MINFFLLILACIVIGVTHGIPDACAAALLVLSICLEIENDE